MNDYRFFPTLLQKHLADQQDNISWLMQQVSLHAKDISQSPLSTIDNRAGFSASGTTRIEGDLFVGGSKNEYHGDVTFAPHRELLIEPILERERCMVRALYVAPPAYEQVRQQLSTQNVLILHGAAQTGKRTTALHFLLAQYGQQCSEITPYLDWEGFQSAELKPNTGYLIDAVPADHAHKLTPFALRRLNRILGELKSHLIITIDSLVMLKENLRDYVLGWNEMPEPAQLLTQHLNWSLASPAQRQSAYQLCQRQELLQILITRPQPTDIQHLAELLAKVVLFEHFTFQQAVEAYQEAAKKAAISQKTSRAPSFQSWQHYVGDEVASVSISHDGQIVVAGSLSKTVLHLNQSGQLKWQRKVGNQAWRVALSADGETSVVGTGSTRPWDRRGRGLFCFAKDGTLLWQKNLEASVWGFSISADGNTIAVGTDNKQLLLFDRQGKPLWHRQVPAIWWHGWVWSTALSADGQLVITGGADKGIRILDRRGTLRAEHQAEGEVFAVSASADGTMSAAGDNEGMIYLFNQHGNLLWQKNMGEKVWQVKLRDDGQQLFVGTAQKQGHLTLYDQRGEAVWQRFIESGVSCLDITPDGQRIAVGANNGAIYLFDEQGNALHQAQAQKKIRDIAISASQETIIAGSEDGLIYGLRRRGA
jgi:outer membrane protein assembly factor BamB